jgi:ATP-binding cassette subfamily C (CFTR/MRP) protein 1
MWSSLCLTTNLRDANTSLQLSYALYQHQLYRHITMLRGSLVSLIYTESLKLEDRLEDATSAVTLMSTDVDRICQSMVFMHDVWARPLELCIGISLLADQLGWIAVVPVLVVVASAIADTRVTALIGGRVKMWTDQVQRRISLTGDVLLSLKSVKMLGLTEPMRVLLQNSRLQELVLQRKFRWSTVWLNALGT